MSIDSKPVLPECVVKCLDKLKKNHFLYCTWVGYKFYWMMMICDFIRSVKPSIRYNHILAFNAEIFFQQGKLLANMGVSEWFWLNDCLCQIWLIKSMHTGNNPIIGGRSVKITSTAWKNKIINFLHNMHVHKSRGFPWEGDAMFW